MMPSEIKYYLPESALTKQKTYQYWQSCTAHSPASNNKNSTDYNNNK